MLDYKKMTLDEIENWCEANGQLEWLADTLEKEVEVKVYPKGEDGKADKSKEAKTETRPISYIQVKKEFVDKFMPEIAPKRKENQKPTMKDRAKKLREKLGK